MFPYSKKLNGFDAPTVWHEFSGLANQHKAVNLGQGFPDWACPDFAKVALCDAVNSNFNQYARSAGEPSLVQAIAKQYSPLFGRDIDPMSEVTISVGATEALYAIMTSYLEPGDEVIVLEPAFDTYPAQIQMVGGITKYVSLHPPPPGSIDWTIDMNDVEKAITSKTKILLLNTPHNPSGKVFTLQELTHLSQILSNYPNIIVVTDEVYEHLVYENHSHVRLATLPNMWHRTLTVTSSGKTFSITGWKVGWVIGPSALIQPITFVNQWTRFSVCTPCQRAVGTLLESSEREYAGARSYYEYLRQTLENRRNRLIEIVKEVGLHPLPSEGGYFLICDTTGVTPPLTYLSQTDQTGNIIAKDRAFCRWLTIEIGVAAIPLSAFYTPDKAHLVSHLIRFCVCKEENTIEEAGKRLKALNNISVTPVTPPTPPAIL
mmetsp:Transcript_37472/g.38159  ORF Transcript_37472/g.38159 Transcript_37472/m.38159 type:complete len:432 (-) Transcript_37472:139-1434(-)